MSPITRLNIVSTEYTANTTLPANKHRGYFMVAATVGAATIELGAGGGKIPLPNGAVYEPNVCTIGEITVETTGTVVIATG